MFILTTFPQLPKTTNISSMLKLYQHTINIFTPSLSTFTFLHFKDFSAPENKDVEDGLTDGVERAVMVDVCIHHLLTRVV